MSKAINGRLLEPVPAVLLRRLGKGEHPDASLIHTRRRCGCFFHARLLSKLACPGRAIQPELDTVKTISDLKSPRRPAEVTAAETEFNRERPSVPT